MLNIAAYCHKLSQDPLLVQGPGGNISWKENNTLWVKASGTWLSQATVKNIFVPVDLAALDKTFPAFIPPMKQTALRPSIETLLHAIFPHKIVLHLHPVTILAHLIRSANQTMLRAIPNSLHWALLDYVMPGPALAQAVQQKLLAQNNLEIIFLKNHGVVIGAPNLNRLDEILQTLIHALHIDPYPIACSEMPSEPTLKKIGYHVIANLHIQSLVLQPNLYTRLKNDWALYPDQIVFLGARPICFDTLQEGIENLSPLNSLPELIFIKGRGVFYLGAFPIVKQLQLECYVQILLRQENSEQLDSLTPAQSAELMLWEAENHRLALNALG